MKRERKGQGSKLNRSEIVQFRLDPRLRFALELMARNEHRTVSSFIEKLVDQAIDTHHMLLQKTDEEIEAKTEADIKAGKQRPDESTALDDYKRISVTDALKHIWHVDELHRFILMAFNTPNLFTYEEECAWDFIKRSPYYWSYYQVNAYDESGEFQSTLTLDTDELEGVMWERLAKHWPLIKSGLYDEIKKQLKEEKLSLDEKTLGNRPKGMPKNAVMINMPASPERIKKAEFLEKRLNKKEK